MREHWKFKIHYKGYPSTHRKVESVYCIDGLYIGASMHTRGRILAHLNGALRRKHVNKQLQEHLIKKHLSGEPIIVEMLSNNVFDESEWIQKLNPKFNVSKITYTNFILNLLSI